MTGSNHAVSGGNSGSTEMRGEVAQKWGKFDAAEVAALTGNDDLVAKVASKYGLDARQAQKEVDALAKGRQL